MMPVPNDLLFGITIGTAPIAARLPATSYGCAVDGQPDKAAVFQCLVLFCPVQNIHQRLTRARRVQPFGEVAQGIIAEAGL